MDDYKMISEAYSKIAEAQFSYAYNSSDGQPKKQLAKFKRGVPDKNSTAPTTASLPTGPQAKCNVAGMGPMGGVENEERQIKGSPKYIHAKEVHEMYHKAMKQAHDLYKKGQFKQLEQKLELLAALARNL